MNVDIVPLLVLLCVGSIVSTIAGGGLAIIMLIVGTFFFDIRTNVTVVSVLMLTIQIAKISHFYRFARWDIIRYYCILAFPLSIVGGLMLFIVPERLPEIGIGVFSIVFVIMRAFQIVPPVPYSKILLVLYGGLNGFIGGIIGNAALMRNPLLLSMGLTKEVFIGTASIIAFIMNIGKISAYIPSISWTNELIVLLVVATPLVFGGVRIGRLILNYVKKEWFEGMLLIIVAFGSIRLLFF